MSKATEWAERLGARPEFMSGGIQGRVSQSGEPDIALGKNFVHVSIESLLDFCRWGLETFGKDPVGKLLQGPTGIPVELPLTLGDCIACPTCKSVIVLTKDGLEVYHEGNCE